MAQRGSITYLGSMRDSSFGIDDECEVFITQRDAMAALEARHRSSDWFAGFPALRPNGEQVTLTPGQLTNEAHIYLWALDEIDRTYAPLLPKHHEQWPINVSDYIQNCPEYVVWVGARQAVRIGSFDEFEEQRLLRAQQDVREAGSVVVTDA